MAAAAGAPVASPAKIYVGNLNKQTTEEQLQNFFGKENVASIEIRPPASFCWITFNSEEKAKAALVLNGKELDGFAIKVEEHRPKPPRVAPNKVVNPNCVFVGNLPPTFEAEQLSRLFEKYGTIENVRLRQFRGPGRSGTVAFSAPEAAQAALELNGTAIEDRPIRVEIEARVRRQGKSKKKKQNAQNAQNNNGQNVQPPAEDTPPNPLRVFVGNIPRDLGKEALAHHFASCGVSEAITFRKGFGFVTLNNPEGVAAALALSGTQLGERPITVKPEERKENRNRQQPRKAAAQPTQSNQSTQNQGQGQSVQAQLGQGQTGGGQGRRGRRRRRRAAANAANAASAGGQDDSKEAKSESRSEVKSNNSTRRPAVRQNNPGNNVVNNNMGNNNMGNNNVGNNNVGNNNVGNNRGRRPVRPKSNPETTVWVGNLPEGTSKEQIRAAAEQVGTVVRVRFPARNKYFAFVEFESPESVEKAVQRQFFTIGDFNAKIERMHGRECRVFLGKLAPATNEAQLRAVLEPFGEVLNIALRTTVAPRKTELKEGGVAAEGGDEEKTFAHVTFNSAASAQQVLKSGPLKINDVDVNPQAPRLRIRRRRNGGTAAARL